MVMTLDHQEHRGRAKSHTASESPGSNIWVVLGQIFGSIKLKICVKKPKLCLVL